MFKENIFGHQVDQVLLLLKQTLRKVGRRRLKCFSFHPKDYDPGSDYQPTKLHMVFDVKHDLRHKARLVAGGHLIDVLEILRQSGNHYMPSCNFLKSSQITIFKKGYPHCPFAYYFSICKCLISHFLSNFNFLKCFIIFFTS